MAEKEGHHDYAADIREAMEIAQKATEADDPEQAQRILNAYDFAQHQKKEGKANYAEHIQNVIEAEKHFHEMMHP